MDKELFYESIAKDFDSIMNNYDIKRRIEVVFSEFLGLENLQGKKLLDAGCGTGWFSKKATELGAHVTAMDLSPTLVQITKDKVPSVNAIVGSVLEISFPDNYFDYVISSEVIEHTPNPKLAVKEMLRVLRPGGKICLTTPNKTTWYFSLIIAEKFKIRKYQGLENWSYFYDFKKFLISNDLQIISYKGIHLFPFIFPFLNPLLRFCDRIFANKFGFACVNLAAYCVKLKNEKV